ncbi:MAG TPA: hypothetical protein PKY59_27640, partial [Pyrinomonadaceae bacterium]|nr:hypothetical protein [Pyrinomonadaceae bacterium]
MQNDVLGQLKFPSIGLIILGSINGLSGLVTLLSGVLRLTGFTGDKLPTDQAERLGFFIGTGFFYGVGFFSLILAPIIIFGAMKM